MSMSHHSVREGLRPFEACHTEELSPLETYSAKTINDNPICKTYKKITDADEQKKFAQLISWFGNREKPVEGTLIAVDGEIRRLRENIEAIKQYWDDLTDLGYKLPHGVVEETSPIAGELTFWEVLEASFKGSQEMPVVYIEEASNTVAFELWQLKRNFEELRGEHKKADPELMVFGDAER